MAMQQYIQQVVEVLRKSQVPEHLKAAEVQLKGLMDTEGYGVILVSILGNQSVEVPTRQQAGIQLKQLIKKRWDPASNHSKDEMALKALTENDKKQLKGALKTAQLIGDPNKKISNLVTRCIAQLAHFDFPDDWEGFLEAIVGMIKQRQNIHLCGGAIAALASCSTMLHTNHLPQVFPVLTPILLGVCGEPKVYSWEMRMNALLTYHQMLEVIGVGLKDSEPELPRKLLRPTMLKWFEVFCKILTEDPNDRSGPNQHDKEATAWGLKLQAVTALCQLVQHFPGAIRQFLPQIMQPFTQCVMACIPLYKASYQDVEAEDSVLDIGGFVDGCFELFEHISQSKSKSINELLKPNLGQITGVIINFMRMTKEEEEMYIHDPNDFAALEEDDTGKALFSTSYNIRMGAKLLIDSFKNAYPEFGWKVITATVFECFKQADQAKAAGQQDWWKQREAALLVLGLIAGEVEEQVKKGAPSGIDIMHLVQNILVPDLQLKPGTPNYNPHLMGRALWAVSHFIELIPNEFKDSLIGATVKALEPANPIPVRLFAARGLGLMAHWCHKDPEKDDLKTRLTPDHFTKFILPTVAGSLHLLRDTNEDTVGAVFDCIKECIVVSPDHTQRLEENVSKLLISEWKKALTTDQEYYVGFYTEIFHLMAEIPKCQVQVQTRCLPLVLEILPQAKEINPSSQLVSGHIEQILTLVNFLVNPTTDGNLPALYLEQVLPMIVQILLKTSDPTLMAEGSDTLAAFCRVVPAVISKRQDYLKGICGIVSKLLASEQEAASAYIGTLVSALVVHLGSTLGQQLIGQMLLATAKRLHWARSQTLRDQLILVFARMIYHHQGAIVNFLVSQGTVNVKARGDNGQFVEQPCNLFEFTIRTWIKNHGDLAGSYAKKVSLSGMAKLFLLKQENVFKLVCQGYPTVALNAGRSTRSKGSANLVKFTELPCPAKLLSIFIREWYERESEDMATELATNAEQVFEEDDNSFWNDSITPKAGPQIKWKMSTSATLADQETFEEFLDMADMVSGFNDEDDEFIDQVAKLDPINKMNIKEFTSGFVKQIAKSDPALLQQLGGLLNQEDKEHLQAILASS